MYRYLTALIVFIAIYTTSCDKNRLYEGYKDFPERICIQNETAEFEFFVKDESVNYNISYNIRNTNAYPFQNLFLQYYLEDSTGNLLSKDLNNVQLFDQVTGIPAGNGLGDIYVLKKPFLEDYHFDNPGLYRVRIDHFMRRDTLPEILSVGIRVESLKD